MSGRKQHFIPQSVLRGWGKKGKGEKLQVVAYTLDRGVFVAATDGVGAERDFYSELSLDGDVETLDDKITAHETSLGQILAELRGLGDGDSVDTGNAAELVTHLVVRNDHFRRAISSAGATMFQQFARELSDEGKAKTAFGFGGDSPSPRFEETIEELWENHGAALAALGFTKEALTAAAFRMVRENFGSIFAEFRDPMFSMLTTIAAKAPERAADAQRRSLDESLAPPLRVELLREFTWSISLSKEALVLPDCVALGGSDSGDALPLMFADKDTLSQVIMPLAPNSMLIGRRDNLPNLDRVNERFVENSWDFFVAQERSDEFDRLRASLRSRIRAFLEEAIKDAVEGASLGEEQ